MSLALFSQIIILVGLGGFLILVALTLVLRKRAKNEQQKAFGQEKSNPLFARFDGIFQAAYNNFMRIPGLKQLTQRIRKRLETLSAYDEYRLRREVMKIIFTILAVFIFVALVLIIIRPSWLVIFWISLGVLFISGGLIDFFVYRVEEKILTQLKDYNNRVRFNYQQTKMVVDAIYEAMLFVGTEMKIQADRIYNILSSVEPKKELVKYEEVAPTRFLKVVAGLSVLVQDKGDVITNNGSAYIRGLSSINQELNNEILYRSKLSYQLSTLSTLSILPIFFALPIKNWAINTFPVMQSFYDSRLGFLAEILVYTISVACYLIIRKMREVTEAARPMHRKRVHWEEKLFKKVPFVEKLVLAFSPEPYTKKFAKLQKLIKDANSPNEVKHIVLHRILLTITAFILLVSGLLYAHYKEKESVLNTFIPETMLAGAVTEADLLYQKEITQFDKDVIEHIQSSKEVVTTDTLKGYVAAQLGVEVNDPRVATTYERIVHKWGVVENSFLKWWELFIVIILVAGISYIPILNLKFKRYLRFKQMETEVHQHLVLISNLRDFEHMSVYEILEWLERFSIVFKEPIQVALLDFDSGPEEALEQLSKDVSFEPFQQIVERLKLAIIRISIKESFDDIDMEREFHLEQRKEEQKRSIKSRGVMGDILGRLPMACLIFFYLVAPLIYIAVVESGTIMTQLN